MTKKVHSAEDSDKLIWRGKKNWLWWPLSFTTYTLTQQRILVEQGLLAKKYEEAYLFRIIDCSLERSLIQRLCGTGTIILYGGDATTPEIHLTNVKNSYALKEHLSKMVIKQRQIHKVSEYSNMNSIYHTEKYHRGY